MLAHWHYVGLCRMLVLFEVSNFLFYKHSEISAFPATIILLALLQAFRKFWARLTDTYSLLFSSVNLDHTVPIFFVWHQFCCLDWPPQQYCSWWIKKFHYLLRFSWHQLYPPKFLMTLFKSCAKILSSMALASWLM